MPADDTTAKSGKRPVGVLSDRTGFRLIKLADVVVREVAAAVEPMGLKPRHFNLLASVGHEKHLSQRELSDFHDLDPNTIVGLVDDLEALGLLKRQRSEQDRRRHELHLTKKGERSLAKAYRAVAAAEERLLAPLSTPEAATLHELTGRLLAPWFEPARPRSARRRRFE